MHACRKAAHVVSLTQLLYCCFTIIGVAFQNRENIKSVRKTVASIEKQGNISDRLKETR